MMEVSGALSRHFPLTLPPGVPREQGQKLQEKVTEANVLICKVLAATLAATGGREVEEGEESRGWEERGRMREVTVKDAVQRGDEMVFLESEGEEGESSGDPDLSDDDHDMVESDVEGGPQLSEESSPAVSEDDTEEGEVKSDGQESNGKDESDDDEGSERHRGELAGCMDGGGMSEGGGSLQGEQQQPKGEKAAAVAKAGAASAGWVAGSQQKKRRKVSPAAVAGAAVHGASDKGGKGRGERASQKDAVPAATPSRADDSGGREGVRVAWEGQLVAYICQGLEKKVRNGFSSIGFGRSKVRPAQRVVGFMPADPSFKLNVATILASTLRNLIPPLISALPFSFSLLSAPFKQATLRSPAAIPHLPPPPPAPPPLPLPRLVHPRCLPPRPLLLLPPLLHSYSLPPNHAVPPVPLPVPLTPLLQGRHSPVSLTLCCLPLSACPPSWKAGGRRAFACA